MLKTYFATDSISVLKDVSDSISHRCVVNKCVEDALSAKKEQNLNTFKCDVYPLDEMDFTTVHYTGNKCTA